MAESFAQAIDTLLALPHLALLYWGSLAMMTRVLCALGAAAAGVYSGSRAERSGLSTFLFFGAFGCFAYVIALGIQIVQ
jgi:Na+/H+-dicarboxylate symporter